MTDVILGLGANVGDRAGNLREAVAALRQLLDDVSCSIVYESAALLPGGAPQEWDAPFLNMALCGKTELAPEALLTAIKTIEREQGRLMRGRWGPREIDIDILAYGDEIVAQPDLTIPHAHLLERDFALIPLAEIAPGWRHPKAGKTARELAEQMQSAVKKTDIVIA